MHSGSTAFGETGLGHFVQDECVQRVTCSQITSVELFLKSAAMLEDRRGIDDVVETDDTSDLNSSTAELPRLSVTQFQTKT